MQNHHPQKLSFVYNAETGFRNQIVDNFHKIFIPSTYECNLCEITFGAFTEKNLWKKFRKESEIEMEFLYRNEFKKQYASKFGHKFTYPIILAITEKGLEVFISTKELNTMRNTEELIGLISKRMEV